MGPEQVLDQLATTGSVQVVIAIGFVLAVGAMGVLWRALRTKDREIAEAAERNSLALIRVIDAAARVHATVEVMLSRAANELDSLNAEQIRELLHAQSRQLSSIQDTLSDIRARYRR